MKTAFYVYNSGDDIARAKAIAAERNGCKTHGVNNRWSSRDDKDIHTLGVLGEMAVAHVLGGHIDTTARPGGDDGRADVILPDGRGVNVKTRTSTLFDFLLDPGKRQLDADYGVLVALVGGVLTLQIMGYCTDDDLRQHGRAADYGHGTRWALSPCYMRPITDLLRTLEAK